MLHNRISTSRLTLPVTGGCCGFLLLIVGALLHSMWIQTAGVVISCLLMMALNNANSLIRVYSRMVSCSFLMLTMGSLHLLQSVPGMAVQIGIIVFLLCIFKAYQGRESMGAVFYANLALTIASFWWVYVLYFMPLLWVLTATRLQASSLRNFMAQIFGMVLPYWFWAAWAVWNDSFDEMTAHLGTLAEFTPLCMMAEMPTWHEWAFTIMMAMIGMIAAVHYVRYSYNDNIRNRMMHYSMMTIEAAAWLFLVLQPAHYCELTRVIIVTASPSIAHYFTFAKTKVSAWVFTFTLLIILILIAFSAWNI